MDPENFIGELYATYLNDGQDAAISYMEQKANGGLDLTGLRNAIFEANGGNPAIAKVEIHPENHKMIPFFNSQLRRSGIDFVEIVPEFNEELTRPLKPFKEDQEAYTRWEKARKFWVPAISVAATIIPVTIWKASFGNSIHYAEVVAAIFQALVIRKIEIATSIYSSPLDKYLWSPEHFQRPGEDTPEMGMVKRKINQMLRGTSDVLNKYLIDKSGFLKAGYIYNYMFNYVYAFTIYSIGGIVAYTNNWIHAYNIGHGFDGLSAFYEYKALSTFLLHNFLGTLGFYFAFGVNQTLIGVLKARGVLSEFQRLKIELTSLYFAKPGRILASTSEGFVVGVVMTSIVGAVVTIPTIIKLLRTNPRAQKIQGLFERNAQYAALVRQGRIAEAEALMTVKVEEEKVGRIAQASASISTKVGSCLHKLNWLSGIGRPTY